MKYDERIFVDKQFEEKLLKNISDRFFKTLKRVSKVEKEYWTSIHKAHWDWVFLWLPYSIRTKIIHNCTVIVNVWFSLRKFELNINFNYKIMEETKEKIVAFNYSDTEKDREILKNNLVLLKNEIENLK